MKRISLVGQQYSRLTVIADADSDARGNTRSLVRCICGVEKIVKNASLKDGVTKSCGCLKQELASTLGKHLSEARWKNHVKKEKVKSTNPVGRPVKVFSTELWNRLKALRLLGTSLRVSAATVEAEDLIDHMAYATIKNYLPQIDAELAAEGWVKVQVTKQRVTFVRETA